jgi:hypothetical protein
MEDLTKYAKGSGDSGFYAEDGKAGVRFPYPTLGGGFGQADFNIDFSAERGVGDLRTAGQGIGLGWTDEAEAAVRSALDPTWTKSYDEIVNQIRADIDEYKTKYPKSAITNEILGSMITAKYGVGKNIVNTMLKMGGIGGVYSAGKADPSEPIVEEGVTQDISFGDAVKERTKEGVFGAGVSAVLGGIFKGAFSARELAKELLKKGINPSPLQMIGIQTKGMEEALAKIPVVGAGFKNAIKDAYQSFNSGVGKELNSYIERIIQKPLKNKITNNDKGNAVFEKVSNNVDNAYTEVLKPLVIRNQKSFIQGIGKILDDNAGFLADNKPMQRKLVNDILRQINSRFKNGVLSQDNLKKAHSAIRAIGRKAEKSSVIPPEVANFYKQLDDYMLAAIKKFNKPEDVMKYRLLDKIYPSFLAYKNATLKALPHADDLGIRITEKGKSIAVPTIGTVTPQDLTKAGIKIATDAGRTTSAAKGNFPFSRTSTTGQEVIGSGRTAKELLPYYVVGAGPALAGTYSEFSTPGIQPSTIGLGGAMALYNTPWGRRMLGSALKRSMGERLSPYLGEKIESSRLGTGLKNWLGM